jgi:uncharacterized membrane protein
MDKKLNLWKLNLCLFLAVPVIWMLFILPLALAAICPWFEKFVGSKILIGLAFIPLTPHFWLIVLIALVIILVSELVLKLLSKDRTTTDKP